MRHILAVFLLALSGIGCASGNYLPKHAFSDPVEKISVPHPVEAEKDKVKTITTFVAFFDPGLWIEVVANGGVWPALALGNGEKFSGYAYLAGIDYWGSFYLRVVFLCGLDDLAKARIVYSSADGGWLYQLSGAEVAYDPRRFDKEEDYQKQIFQEHGMTLSELEIFYRNYFRGKDLLAPNDLTSVSEITVGSPEWDEFKERTSQTMRHHYKVGAQVRSSYLPLDKFKTEAVEMPGFNSSQRWLKNTKVMMIFPFWNAGVLALGVASIVSDAVVAGIDDSWSGSYARAETIRHQMAPLLRQVCRIYQDLLEERDRRIRELQLPR